jgi:hypothetical protein
MTNIQEERMFDLFGKEDICNEEGNELTTLVAQMCSEFDNAVADIII